MRTSTLAQGPLGLGGEYITIGGTIYNMESAADYTNATGALRAFLDARDAAAAAESAIRSQDEAERRARLIRSGGAAVVSVEQMRLAAFAAGQLTALDNAIAALPASEFKIRWQCNSRAFTRAELQFLVPGTMTNLQANQLFAAALQQ